MCGVNVAKDIRFRKMRQAKSYVFVISKRLKAFRKKLGINQKQFADSIGIPQATLSRYESGAMEPKAGFFLQLYEIYGNVISELLTGKEPITSELPKIEIQTTKQFSLVADAVERGSFIPIKLLKDSAAAGAPLAIDENDVEGYALIYADREWMPNAPDKYTCVHVHGDSMYPVLADGDLVAIDHAEVPRSISDLKRLDGKMVAFRVNGGVTIKWLKFDEAKETVVGVPENKDELDHLVILKGPEINDGIVGLVRWWWSKR